MSITPRGMSVQEAYRLYAEGNLYVNRKYQRKLVWTVEEKSKLVDSIMNNLPIPLILLAQRNQDGYEIIDGVQRMNAIFSFIENRFAWNGKYFDVNQSSRAKQLGDAGQFEYQYKNLVPKGQCADFLDYQLAITIYPTADENSIIDIFSRINSGGRQLSNQEKRQAGMMDDLSNLIRKISEEIRGDVSKELLLLSEMPEISIESEREKIGYGLKAEEIFWVQQGILSRRQLRESEDEEIITDITASILLDKPLARSREFLDKIYDTEDPVHSNLLSKLLVYGPSNVKEHIKTTLSFFSKIFENSNGNRKFSSVVNPRANNTVKNSFYAVFMAFFELIVKEELIPENYEKIIEALNGLQSQIKTVAHYSKESDRKRNIDQTKGLIRPYFVHGEKKTYGHGPKLALDLENSIRRSKVETNRYEFKQGFYDLSPNRKFDSKLIEKLVKTICGIANVGPESEGFVFIGVADKMSDVERIKELDNIEPIEISNNRYIVGIDREYTIENLEPDSYIDRMISLIKNTGLSDPLKQQVIQHIDQIDYKGLSVIRLYIPKQKEPSFVNEKCYVRENSNTVEKNTQEALAIYKLFN